MTARLRYAGEAGLTLIEVLVTVVIMGLAFVIVIGGVFTGIVASDANRHQSDAAASLYGQVEVIKALPYQDCASQDYASHPGLPALPAGFARSLSCSPIPGTEAQSLVLTVASDDGRASETVEVVKRRP